MPEWPLIAPGRAALFGKLPAHGDFVRRGDPSPVRRLDEWLSSEVNRLAASLGDAYDARLAILPAWSFVLADGSAGALVASHDRVGRVFPVACCVNGGRTAAEAAATLLVQARDGVSDADALHRSLMDLPAEAGGQSADAGAHWWRPMREIREAFTIADLPERSDFARLLDGAD